MNILEGKLNFLEILLIAEKLTLQELSRNPTGNSVYENPKWRLEYRAQWG